MEMEMNTARIIEAASRLGAQGWAVRSSAVTDNRTRKRYWREAIITVPAPDLPPGQGFDPVRRLSMTPILLALRKLGPFVFADYGYHPTQIHLTLHVPAERPSAILSEDAVVRYCWSLVPQIAAVFDAAAVEERESVRRDTATRQARLLLSEISDGIATQAHERMRLAQRIEAVEATLAALRAEAEAEARLLAEAALDSVASEASLAAYEPEARAYVRRTLADDAAKRACTLPLVGGAPSLFAEESKVTLFDEKKLTP